MRNRVLDVLESQLCQCKLSILNDILRLRTAPRAPNGENSYLEPTIRRHTGEEEGDSIACLRGQRNHLPPLKSLAGQRVRELWNSEIV